MREPVPRIEGGKTISRQNQVMDLLLSRFEVSWGNPLAKKMFEQDFVRHFMLWVIQADSSFTCFVLDKCCNFRFFMFFSHAKKLHTCYVILVFDLLWKRSKLLTSVCNVGDNTVLYIKLASTWFMLCMWLIWLSDTSASVKWESELPLLRLWAVVDSSLSSVRIVL